MITAPQEKKLPYYNLDSCRGVAIFPLAQFNTAIIPKRKTGTSVPVFSFFFKQRKIFPNKRHRAERHNHHHAAKRANKPLHSVPQQTSRTACKPV